MPVGVGLGTLYPIDFATARHVEDIGKSGGKEE